MPRRRPGALGTPITTPTTSPGDVSIDITPFTDLPTKVTSDGALEVTAISTTPITVEVKPPRISATDGLNLGEDSATIQQTDLADLVEETAIENLNRYSEYEDLSLDLFFDITGSDSQEYSNNKLDVLDTVKTIKNLINDKVYLNANKQFKSVLKKINNYEYITEKISQKIEATENAKTMLKEGIELRKETIQKLSLINKINKYLVNKQQGKEFNLITNYFVENYLITSNINDSYLTTDTFSFEDNNTLSSIKSETLDIFEIKNHLMIDLSEIDTVTKNVDYTKIVVQNFINNARSFYTLMPLCQVSNIPDTFRASRYVDDDIICYVNEFSGLRENIFDSINVSTKNFNTEKYLRTINSIISTENSTRFNINNIGRSRIVASAADWDQYNPDDPVITKNALFYYDYDSITLDIEGSISTRALSQNLSSEESSNSLGFITDSFSSHLFDTKYSHNLLTKIAISHLSSPGLYRIIDDIDIAEVLYKALFNPDFSINSQLLSRAVSFIALMAGLRFELSESDIILFLLTLPKSNVFYQYKPIFSLLSNEDNSLTLINTLNEATSYKEFDHYKLKFKVDSFVKKLKLNHLETKGLSIEYFNDVVNNIKKSTNKLLLQSYSYKDKNYLSALNKENTLYDVLFKEDDENEIYSNLSFSLGTEKIEGKIFRSALTPEFDKNVAENVMTMFSNYFNEGMLFSSSTFMRKVINDFNEFKDKLNNNAFSSDHLTTELLYVSYFNVNFNKDTKDEEKKNILTRILSKSIQQGTQADEALKNAKINKYQFDTSVYDSFIDDIEQEVGILANAQERKEKTLEIQNKYYNEYINSSDSLLMLKETLFDRKYLNKIKDLSNFSYMCNKMENLSNPDMMLITILKIENIFPFRHLFETIKCKFAEDDEAPSEESLENNYHKQILDNELKSKIRIKKQIFLKFNYGLNVSPSEIISQDSLDKYITGDVFVSIVKDSFQRVYDDDSKKTKLVCILKDDFEKITELNSNTFFPKILETIDYCLRFAISEYRNLTFVSENEIFEFIDNNPYALEITQNVMEIYSEFYLDFYKKFTFDYNMELYNHVVDPYVTSDVPFINISNINKFNNDWQVINTWNGFNRNSSSIFNDRGLRSSPFTYTPNRFVFENYEKLLSLYSNENLDYRKNRNSNNNSQSGLSISSDIPSRIAASEYNDIFYLKMSDVVNSLKKSDFYQAVSFDITRETLRAIKNSEENLSLINNEKLLEFAADYNIDEEDFLERIDNKYYQNILVKNIENVSSRNKIFKEEIIEPLSISEVSQEDFYNNYESFDSFKHEVSYKDISINDDMIYCFDFPYNKIELIGDNALVKLTILPKDIRDTRKLFYPLVYYFTANIVNKNFDIKENNNFLFFENSKNLTSDLDGGNITPANLDDIKDYIKNIVRQKLNIRQDYNLNLFANSIIENHENSINLQKLLYTKHDINLSQVEFNERNELDILTSAITDNFVRNIFNVSKQEITDDMVFNEFNEISVFNNNLNILLSSERDNLEIRTTDLYDRYVVSITSEDLLFNFIDDDASFTESAGITSDGFNNKVRISFMEVHNRFDILNSSVRRFDINEREFLTFTVSSEVF
jgi:hypothetical protein